MAEDLKRQQKEEAEASPDALCDTRVVSEKGLLPLGLNDTGIVLERILPYLANRLTFRLNSLLKEDLRAFGLTIPKWRVLAVLATNEWVSVNELADYVMIEQPTTSRLIDRMEADKLLCRKHDPQDGRVRSISLSPLGLQRYEAVRDTTLAHTRRALHGLTAAERVEFERLVAKMGENLNLPLSEFRE